MPTLNIGGQKVKVGDDFLQLSPDQQNATVEEIASSLGAGPAAQSVPEAALPPPATAKAPSDDHGLMRTVDDYVRAAANGMTLGLADRIAAGMESLTGIGGKTGDYAANLSNEQGRTAQFATDHPIASIGANAAGGLAVPLGAIGAASRATGLGAKMLYGAGAGAGIGGIQGAAESKDWANLPQTARDAAIGSGVGFVVGGSIPAAGKMIGAGYNAAANAIQGNADGMSRGASRHLVDALAADGPQAVRAQLDRLGPDAMLADAGPALLGKAQGASLNSDEGRSVLQGALTARNEGTNARIMGDVNKSLGPAEDPQTVTNAITARRSEVDARNYPAAVSSSPPVDTGNALVSLGAMIQGSVGMERRALSSLRDMMMTERQVPRLDPIAGNPMSDARGNRLYDMVPEPQTDPAILHKIKGELDNVIQYDAPGLGVPAGAVKNQQAALKNMRYQVNNALEDQVPGYEPANRASQALAQRQQSVELGTQYLGSGKTTASPGRFSTEFNQLDPGTQIAFAKGSRGEIERILGTKANDLQALRGELQGEGGWNTAKLATVHGQDAADQLVSTVDRNLKFRDTYNKVVENSQTAQRTASSNAMKPVPPGEVPLLGPGTTGVGLVVGGGKRLLNAGYNAVRPDETRSFGEVANVLTARGAERDRRLQDIATALEKRRGNASAATANGDRAALIAAIAANGYARSGPRRNRD